MAEFYEKKFGVPGNALYPGRDGQMPTFATPSPRNAQRGGPLQFAFSGSLNYAGYGEMLERFAAALAAAGHRLLLFGGHSLETARKYNLDRPHVKRIPAMPVDQLVRALRDQVDALLVPMTFRPDMRFDMEISFPSKLTEYTTIGVPIVIWGPAYSSAVRWGRDNAGAAEVIDVDETEAVVEVVKRLADDPAMRERLGKRAMEVGEAQFSRAAITKQFLSVVSKER
jgi:glycosyltransferase involved in cell wall biosynthesis